MKGNSGHDFRFYGLTSASLEQALPRLLEKIIASGKRCLIRCGTPERLQHLDEALWTYGRGSFLPHGTSADDYPDKQPIYLTCTTENPNQSSLLVIDEDRLPDDWAQFPLCVMMFSLSDASRAAIAKDLWQKCGKEGHARSYWVQEKTGAWVKGDWV